MSIRKHVTVAAAAIAMSALTVSPAAAGHCADNGGPGHSDFATHAQAHEGNEGGHQGWASCEEGARASNGKPFRG